MDEHKYPIGQAKVPAVIAELEITKWILMPKGLPSRLEKLTIDVMN